MIVIEDSHNGNDTIVIGHWCNNGCTTFHIKDLDRVCQNHRVSVEDKQVFLEAMKTHNPEAEDWDALSNNEDPNIIYMIIQNGKIFEKFAHHREWSIRREVARAGQCLELLSKDPESSVRYAVAEQGQFLDAFLSDSCWIVRQLVANKGHRLDHFINDIDPDVREAVVRQRYGLDILKSDMDPAVRWEVANQSYALDELVNDPVHWVQEKALEMRASQA